MCLFRKRNFHYSSYKVLKALTRWRLVSTMIFLTKSPSFGSSAVIVIRSQTCC